ncbi:GTP-binding protein gtr1 [Tieghemiomyces parasiticus]|uniref:GTP-binding protein n=1 Tax=Tieghemiomyces parasiticus TaxID=78921 RepID=A0A9W8AFD5_9FUNG|nr:GTP-binding protein gtr1 [Tieghemiomyces parasiticus]
MSIYETKKKILLLGKSGSGKTSMRSIIFSHYSPYDTRRLGPTMDVENISVRVLGRLQLTLWDCGGQENFMFSYFSTQREYIFKSVEMLIYVFDMEARDFESELLYLEQCLDAIKVYSKDAKIVCLLHKMDLVSAETRDRIVNEKTAQLMKRTGKLAVEVFSTSIFEPSLYRAWSRIMNSIMPNIEIIRQHLRQFCEVADVAEVVLFEKTSFLAIAEYQAQEARARKGTFDEMSSILKTFNLALNNKRSTSFRSIRIRLKGFILIITNFTKNTVLMVITDNPAMSNNIKIVCEHFKKLEGPDPTEAAR